MNKHFCLIAMLAAYLQEYAVSKYALCLQFDVFSFFLPSLSLSLSLSRAIYLLFVVISIKNRFA